MSITIDGSTITNSGTSLSEKVGTTTLSKSTDSSGYVLLRNKPAWRGYADRGSSSDNSIWNNFTMQFNTTNSGFNASTGRFTAPVAGTYVLEMVGITDGNAGDIRYSMMKNGNQNSSHSIVQATNGQHGPTNVTNVWRLAAGDYVECIVYSGAGHHGDQWSSFSGFLAG